MEKIRAFYFAWNPNDCSKYDLMEFKFIVFFVKIFSIIVNVNNDDWLLFLIFYFEYWLYEKRELEIYAISAISLSLYGIFSMKDLE